MWQLNEPTSPTGAKLWNLVSAPCLVFSCMTAHTNKPAPSTKSAILVHIKYLYNSKLNWDSFSPYWNCQNSHKDARPRCNRRQRNCLQTCEQTIQKFLFYLNWHAASQLNCYEFLQQMTKQNFEHSVSIMWQKYAECSFREHSHNRSRAI